jgi:16S rRNA (guanine527-N7)-methyltransferase
VAALGLRPEAARRLTTYLDLLAAWNERINLTGLNTSADRVRVLVEAILPARDLPAPGTLLDLGSGNGSPGLVLAATRDDLDVTLLEPRAKRWAFLREAVRQMGLAVSVLRERHDSYGGRPARTVTLRALALPIAQLRPLVEPGGQILVFGRPPREANGVAMQPLMGSDGRVVCHSLRVPRETSVAAVADPEPT